MAAPFAPDLVSPTYKGSANYTGVSLAFRHRAFTPGEDMADYQIRRKQLSPTPGSYEYWTGSAWGTATWVALAAEDKEVVTIATGAWTEDATYEWGVRTRNGSAEESAWSDPGLLSAHASPSLTVAITSPAVDSRPTFNWLFGGGTGRTQLSYHFVLYTEAETQKAGFNANPVFGYDSLWDSQVRFSGTTFSERIDVDLPSSGTYKLYGIVADDTGLESGWALLSTFTTSFTPPSPPVVSYVVNSSDGTISITAISQFNLLTSDTASFESGLGDWTEFVNAQATWDQVNSTMDITFAGASYDQLGTDYTTYALLDSGLGDYDATTSYRDVATTKIQTTGGTGGIAVTAAEVYSGVVTVRPNNQQLEVYAGITWYNSSGSVISSVDNSGSPTTCPNGVSTDVSILSQTAPALTTYASLWIVVNDTENVIGETMDVETAAFAASDTVAWSPGGGAEGIGFVMQRSVDGGDWEYLWGASHDDPALGPGGASDRVTLDDRSAPLGPCDLDYRVFAVQTALTSPVYSDPATFTVTGGLTLNRWFLRSENHPELDIRVIVDTFDWADDLHTEILLPSGGKAPIAFRKNLPKDARANVSMILLTEADRNKFQSLTGDATYGYHRFFLQQNIGKSGGLFLRPVGAVRYSQRRSIGSSGTPSDVHTVSFQAQVMA